MGYARQSWRFLSVGLGEGAFGFHAPERLSLADGGPLKSIPGRECPADLQRFLLTVACAPLSVLAARLLIVSILHSTRGF
jgi:hypothetical protein